MAELGILEGYPMHRAAWQHTTGGEEGGGERQSGHHNRRGQRGAAGQSFCQVRRYQVEDVGRGEGVYQVFATRRQPLGRGVMRGGINAVRGCSRRAEQKIRIQLFDRLRYGARSEMAMWDRDSELRGVAMVGYGDSVGLEGGDEWHEAQ
jgi:hypothetical protein